MVGIDATEGSVGSTGEAGAGGGSICCGAGAKGLS